MFTLKKKHTHTQVFCQIYKNFLEVKLYRIEEKLFLRYLYILIIKYINIFVRVVKCKIHFVLKLGLIH